MANIENLIRDKTARDESWKQQMQENREQTSAMQNEGIMVITSDPASFCQYLTLQGDNATYSAGNIALAMFQLNEPTIIGTEDRWKSLGRHVLAQEAGNGAKIFVRSSRAKGRGYDVGMAYDISQTQGREYTRPITLVDNTPKTEKALATLLNYSPVLVQSSRDLGGVARYDQRSMTLLVNPDYSDREVFSAVAAEIALARIHDKGRNPEYDRANCELYADSVSYLLCRNFGIDRALPDASEIANLNDGLDADSRKYLLDYVQGMAKRMSRGIEQQITPQQRTRNTFTPPVR